jgi:hypothetical protein
VTTWTSATASTGIRACDPARCPITSSLLLAPSSMKLLLRESSPLALIASEPNDSVLMLAMTPGSSATAPMKLPFTDGSIAISRLVTLPPISFDVRSTSGVSAVTVIVSVTPPGLSGISNVVVRPRSRRTPFAVVLRKA